MSTVEVKPKSQYYQQLKGKVDDKVLHLQDQKGIFLLDKVDGRNLKYFTKMCVNKPWLNHILLSILVQADKNLDPKTTSTMLGCINTRMVDLFSTYHLSDMNEFDTDVHLYEYLKGEIFPEHSNNMRMEFSMRYNRISYSTKKWLKDKLDSAQQVHFEKFLFPSPFFDSGEFSFNKLALEQRQTNRKDETDAIVPYLPEIRSNARFRWSQMKRLRDAFQKAIEKAKKLDSLPLDFNYEEPVRVGERFYFRLWDKPSFVLRHKDQFSAAVVQMAMKRKGPYSNENNEFFVEFIRTEHLHDGEAAESLWFLELVKKGVIGQWNKNADDKESVQKHIFLTSCGYSEEDCTINSLPFFSKHKGILTNSTFIALHKDKVGGILFEIEPFYAACTFGLLALDIFTTTGARLNELLQLKNTKDCIQIKRVNDKLNYSFRAIPKGRDEVEEFYISKQTMGYIQNVVRMLKDHYQSDKIPSVKYKYFRYHLFPDPHPYYFQYHNKAFDNFAISSSMRFLLHGLRYENQEGNPVIIKSHLLRHAFATEAVQRQKMSIDIVAKILHQRDLNVTRYYSAPTPTQISQAVGELHDVISSYVDVDEVLLRSPAELQKELDEHSKKVGVFNKVLGGTCVTDFVCPTKMACLGCKAKIPEPEQENELLEVIELSKDMEKRFGNMGLDVEVRKAIEMRKQARTELKEIDSIKKFREEQKYEPTIHIYE
jgi:integrase